MNPKTGIVYDKRYKDRRLIVVRHYLPALKGGQLMSLLDSGIIAIKDGQLVPESDRCRQGTGGWFELEGTDIYFWGGGFGKNFNSRKKNTEKKAYPFWQLQISNRFVDHWQCNGIDFKIKLLGKDKSIALINFTYSKIHYHVILGYDVSLDQWWYGRTKKEINRLLCHYLKPERKIRLERRNSSKILRWG